MERGDEFTQQGVFEKFFGALNFLIVNSDTFWAKFRVCSTLYEKSGLSPLKFLKYQNSQNWSQINVFAMNLGTEYIFINRKVIK